jgi:hypothetical protein
VDERIGQSLEQQVHRSDKQEDAKEEPCNFKVFGEEGDECESFSVAEPICFSDKDQAKSVVP